MGADQTVEDSPPRAISLRPHPGMLRFLAFQVFIWTVYGVVHFAASIPAIAPNDRAAIGLAKAVRALTGLGTSSALVPLLEWKKSWRGLIPLSAAAAVGAGFIWMIVDRAAYVTVASMLAMRIPWEDFIHGVDLDYLFVMIAWTAGYVASMLLYRGRIEREELLTQRVRMQEARMSLLAAQLNPHFLFNSLNTIRSLAAEDAGKTREVVSRLSAFLRRVIGFDTSTPVRLAEEIELARDYLAVEQARFEGDLEMKIQADSSGDDVLVPALILQPLIENAIKYGTADAGGVRHVAITISMSNDQLVLRVENAGPLDPGWREGIGLQLTRNRLSHLYGNRASFNIADDSASVVAEVRIIGVRGRRRDS